MLLNDWFPQKLSTGDWIWKNRYTWEETVLLDDELAILRESGM